MTLFSPKEKISNHQAAKVLEAYLFAISAKTEEMVSETHCEMCSQPVVYGVSKNYLAAIRFTCKKIKDNLLNTIVDLEKEFEV